MIYNKSVQYYDAIYHFVNYREQSVLLHKLIQQHNPAAKTLLDVCCGTAKHTESLRENYAVEGLDINPDLLKIAKMRCPEITFHQEDMVDFDLGHTFDVVICLFSSIAYAKTIDRMERAISCMERHLRPGGLMIIEPWFSLENYWVDRLTANFVDQPELKISWMYKSEIEGSVSILDIHYLVGTPQGVQYFSERHEFGLFSNEEYLTALRKVGLEVLYDPVGLNKRGMYIGLKKQDSFE